jgi:hypothetical protein
LTMHAANSNLVLFRCPFLFLRDISFACPNKKVGTKGQGSADQ